MEALREHKKLLREHKEVIREHKKYLREHKELLREHKKLLREHKEVFREHKKYLREHKEVLREHKKLLREHKEYIFDRKPGIARAEWLISWFIFCGRMRPRWHADRQGQTCSSEEGKAGYPDKKTESYFIRMLLQFESTPILNCKTVNISYLTEA